MKRLYELTAPVLLMTALFGGAASAGNSVRLDRQGNGGDVTVWQENGGDTTIGSYGDDQWLDVDLVGTGDFGVLALGDGVTGKVIGRGSDGALIVMGMCPEGMRNETVLAGPRSSGLRIPRCVW
ncbi:hypothetical protein [Pseudogemmobacter bohemicus]|uniref:hypothetical protein n=1 Tax=Pseudogemmobacter bohemicus TaxID=2250708 RepID=UPI000DD341C0|nr:hypothetical protein [Pseudogemmobacter bohemicus]